MRLALLSLAHISLCNDANPFGWSPWVLDADQAADKLAQCEALHKAGRIGGVYLVCGCGALPSLVECGYYPSGDPVQTCWAGHTDGMMHEVVYQFAEVMPVTVSIGLPAGWSGLDALADECRRIKAGSMPIEFVLDASGSNASARVRATIGTIEDARVMCRLESRPLNGPLDDTDRFATMSARLQTLVHRGQGFAGDIAVFNHGQDKNRWNEPLALIYERGGATVAQPLETMPVEGDAGGGV